MKKNSLKKAFSAVAVAAVAVSAASMNAFAEGYNKGIDQATIDGSEIKPVVTVTQKVISLDDAKKQQVVEISVTGADGMYASTGIHVHYDKRLTIPLDEDGDLSIAKGAAVTKLNEEKRIDDTAAYTDPENWEHGMNGFFYTTGGSANRGKDGIMLSITFDLPANAKEGDVYPIDIIYQDGEANKDKFINTEMDQVGKIMEGYFFTRGIFNAETNKNFVASTADVAQCSALASIPKSYDGYIAIAGNSSEESTSTSTTTTTTTTTASTTTSTPVSSSSGSSSGSVSGTGTGSSSVSGTGTGTGTGSSTNGNGNGSRSSSASSSGSNNDNPKTGVAGVGVAAAGLAVALGTAFVLRKKED